MPGFRSLLLQLLNSIQENTILCFFLKKTLSNCLYIDETDSDF